MNSSPDPLAHTVDAFHRGRFVVVQPKGAGHRSGIDAMLLAGAVPTEFSGHVVDLGAGAGAAGLAVVSRCSGARVTLVEKDPLMVSFAHASVRHPSNQIFAGKTFVIETDVGASAKVRNAVGLQDNSFDFAIMNPPFNLPRDRQTPDTLRADAHVMTDGLFEAWLRAAAAIIKSGGGIAIIARPQSLQDIINAARNRFGALCIVPIHPRPHDDAIRIIVSGVKGSRADLTLAPPLILHDEGGNALLPRADGICNGLAGLFVQSA